MLLTGQLSPDPRASFVVLFPRPAQLASLLLCFQDLIKSFPVLLRCCHYPPTGNVFCQWQEYGIFPSPPSLSAPFLRNLPALKAADRPERCRPEGLAVCKPWSSYAQPPLCSKMWCFLGSKKVLFLHLCKVKSQRGVESPSRRRQDSS